VVDELFKYYSYFAQKYQVFVGIESVAFSQILQQWVEKEQRERKILFKVIELKTGNRQKETRIQRLQPLFENGGILLHPTNCDTLRTQLLSWPSSSHDDHPDALAYILDVLQLPSDGKVISLMGDKKKDHTYDDFEEVMSRLESGDDSTDWRSL
jgi:predicted phage terminase large subunit-like protein